MHGTSLRDPEKLPLLGQRLATFLLVADGVGGAVAGGEASRLATESVMHYVGSSLTCYHAAGSASEDVFLDALREAALQAHAAIRQEASERLEERRPRQRSRSASWCGRGCTCCGLAIVRCYHFSNGTAASGLARPNGGARTGGSGTAVPITRDGLAIRARPLQRARRGGGDADGVSRCLVARRARGGVGVQRRHSRNT